MVRRGRVTDVSGLEGALDVARRAAESPSVWLRGQAYPWPPYSSLARREVLGTADDARMARDRIEYFLSWVDTQPDLKEHLLTDEHTVAVAQHYGVPTYFLDFTYLPEVAAYFATDCAAPPPGPEACIYLLDCDELSARMREAGREQCEALQLYPVVERVPDLWRLEAQAGVFLNAPGKWFEWYEMDRIVFPRAPLNEALRSRVYPRERSALEDRLDRYFEWERMRETTQWIRAHAPTNHIVSAASSEERIHDYVLDVEPHVSWQPLRTAGWASPRPEPYSSVIGPTFGIPQNLVTAYGGLFAQVEANVYTALQRQTVSRTQSVSFRCLFEAHYLTANHIPHLDQCLQRLWDGMRRLPYSDLALAGAIARCISLATLGLGWWSDWRGRGVDSVMSERLETDLLCLEMRSSEGAGARCLAPQTEVRQALRADLNAVLIEKGRELASDLKLLLQVVHDPRMLFDFGHLQSLMADYWIPTQVLLAREQSPVFFSPLSIVGVGMP